MKTSNCFPSLRWRLVSSTTFCPFTNNPAIQRVSALRSGGTISESMRCPSASSGLKPKMRVNSPLTRVMRYSESRMVMASGAHSTNCSRYAFCNSGVLLTTPGILVSCASVTFSAGLESACVRRCSASRRNFARESSADVAGWVMWSPIRIPLG
jgi:hypothetical protein